MPSPLAPHASLEQTPRGPLVLLFYDGYDLKAYPGVFGKLKSKLHHVLRYTKRSLCHQQVRTGYYTAFLGLVKSLKAVGCNVKINDFAAAKARPDYPIGMAGFPSALAIDLPNPRIFGHGDFGMPGKCDRVATSSKFVTLIMPCAWAYQLFRPYCGNKMWIWFTGIDTKKWRDLSRETKHYDFVVYDKIRWHRGTRVREVLAPILAHLDAKKLTYTTLRYGQHHHADFIKALAQSRALLFVCEHETQGIAYQEALASNLPVLAWDEGELVDPEIRPFLTDEMQITSVPYFDATCGLTFKMNDFAATCDRFMQQRDIFTPRRYIEEHLSLEIAGQRYLNEYARIAQGCITPRSDEVDVH